MPGVYNKLLGRNSGGSTRQQRLTRNSWNRVLRCRDIGSKCVDSDLDMYRFGLDANASIADLAMERLVKGSWMISNHSQW